MTEIELKHVKLAGMLSNKKFYENDGCITITADYKPEIEHSRLFCKMTKDRNPIHLAPYPGYSEVITPWFMQTSVATILVREIIRKAGINAVDYPFIYRDAKMEGTSAIITGRQYKFQANLYRSNSEGILNSDAVVLKDGKTSVFRLYMLMRKEMPKEFFPKLNNLVQVHASQFLADENFSSLDFGNLIGSCSQESNIYALAGSSSIVFDAVDKGVIKDPTIDGLVALYNSQKTYSDTSSSLDLRKGVNLELYLLDKSKFGQKTEKGEPLDMKILAKNNDGKLLYLSEAPLTFLPKRFIEIALRRAGLKPKT